LDGRKGKEKTVSENYLVVLLPVFSRADFEIVISHDGWT
jgi:hypothetical protein